VQAKPENEAECEGGKKRRKAAHIHIHDKTMADANDVAITLHKLMPADALRLRGSHNHANALAALLLVQAAGVSIAKALHGLRSYAGAPNRCELVQIINDVEYINDSKGTNVGATVAALQGLSAQRKRLVLIAGGVGKGQDFAPLTPAVAQFCKAVVLIGQAAADLHAAFKDTGVPIHLASDLDTATQQAARLASTGDAVLLSPACASFDMFKSYAHRAQVFVAAVQALAAEGGN
jgi:UDP-N-acetylmuramoylalanine--D-glutamate ligase